MSSKVLKEISKVKKENISYKNVPTLKQAKRISKIFALETCDSVDGFSILKTTHYF